MTDDNALLRQVTFDGTVAILGAGFSVPAKVPPTSEISSQFLTFNRDWPTPSFIQQAISRCLERYWQEAFEYGPGKQVPSFEDHFTLIDLSANAGHALGHYLTPAKLRALRRISIHRVFDILDCYEQNESISIFLDSFARSEESAIISLNWDIIVENHLDQLGHDFYYDMPGEYLTPRDEPMNALPIVKLHGSANWLYCDSCHQTVFGNPGHGKTALHHFTFIEPHDFRVLHEPAELVDAVEQHVQPYNLRSCRRCYSPCLGARVATFSYAKALGFYPFQAAWDNALDRLMQAEQWIFIGYSLPEADFEFRHLLKTAQMNSAGHGPKKIWVVIKEKGDEVASRYRRFFGLEPGWIHSCGLECWVSTRITAAT